MSGYRVLLDMGMSGQEVEFPEADCWTIDGGGYLKVGTGETEYGDIQGETFGSFNWNKVCGIVKM